MNYNPYQTPLAPPKPIDSHILPAYVVGFFSGVGTYMSIAFSSYEPVTAWVCGIDSVLLFTLGVTTILTRRW